jgi:hypothetical protein
MSNSEIANLVALSVVAIREQTDYSVIQVLLENPHQATQVMAIVWNKKLLGDCHAGADRTLYFYDFQLSFVGSSLVPVSEDVLNVTSTADWIDLRAVIRA